VAFRFIHAADIHLDSPMLSLEEYPGAPLEEIAWRLARRWQGWWIWRSRPGPPSS